MRLIKPHPNPRLAADEIWREGSRVLVDYDRNLIHVTSFGDFDPARAMRCKKFIYEILENNGSYFDLVIDISKEGKQAPGTRKIFKAINAHPKVRHVAICGVNSLSKIMHTIMVGFRKHPKVRRFSDSKAALAWLNGFIGKARAWFDAGKGELPQNNQEVVIDIQGTNYIGYFDATKAVFRVEAELQQMTFSIHRHTIRWKPYRQLSGRVERFPI